MGHARLVYLGASCAVLVIAEALSRSLSLPDWIVPVADLLVVSGRVVLLMAAWILSLFHLTVEGGVVRLESRSG